MKPALFMDRDGTVTREVGYVNHPSRLELLPGSAAAIRQARAAGYLCILVTNQAGVARGYFPEERVHQTHRRLQELLAAEDTALDAIYYCPHHPSAGDPPFRADCDCRKPRPGMLRQAMAEWEIDTPESAVIGDKISDVETAHAQGMTGILVRTGYGQGEEEFGRAAWTTTPEHIADDLAGAVNWILSYRGTAS